MSRSNKKVEEPESDSDWDSLPGDVTEPGSSPEHKPATQKQSHSPVPPKQPNIHHGGSGKHHHVTAKPLNIYKNTLNTSQKAATTFEDKSGGLWNDNNDNSHASIKSHHLKEQSNRQGNHSKSSKEKKGKQKIEEQENKRPPFTDFKEALSAPIPSSEHKRDNHEFSGVNQAYRVDNSDNMHNTNHDSWDESDTETALRMQQSHRHEYQTEKHIEIAVDKNIEPKQKSKKETHHHHHHDDKSMHEADFLALQHGQQFRAANNSLQFENCCLVQVNEGPFDERYRPSFFHGSKNHFHVREDDPKPAISDIADKSEVVFQRLWREVFGVLQIVINFFTIFALELFKVIVHSLRYFIAGILYTSGNHLTKPLLAAVFNNIIQPFSILVLNLFTIVKNLFQPILELTREFCTQISIPLRAFRLFEVNWVQKIDKNGTYRDAKVI